MWFVFPLLTILIFDGDLAQLAVYTALDVFIAAISLIDNFLIGLNWRLIDRLERYARLFKTDAFFWRFKD